MKSEEKFDSFSELVIQYIPILYNLEKQASYNKKSVLGTLTDVLAKQVATKPDQDLGIVFDEVLNDDADRKALWHDTAAQHPEDVERAELNQWLDIAEHYGDRVGDYSVDHLAKSIPDLYRLFQTLVKSRLKVKEIMASFPQAGLSRSDTENTIELPLVESLLEIAQKEQVGYVQSQTLDLITALKHHDKALYQTIFENAKADTLLDNGTESLIKNSLSSNLLKDSE
jgi:hypothetical protein